MRIQVKEQMKREFNIRKHLLTLLLAGVMALTLAGCGGGSAASGSEDSGSAVSGSTGGNTASGSEGSDGQSASFSGDLKTVDVVLDWYPNAIHTFLYEAVDRGYFEEEGIEVNLISPAESIDAITFVASGRAQIGLTYPIEVIQANENDMPVRALAAVSQLPLDCLCSLASNTAVTADMSSLKGRKVGYSGTAVSEATVRTIMKNAGLSDDDYEMINVGFDLVTSLTTESVDLAAGVFLNDEVVTMQNAGYEVNVFAEQDYGVPSLYGLVMAVNADAAEADPELYEAFLSACRKGFADMKADEDEALSLIMTEMNSEDNPLDETQQRQSYEILLPRMETEDAEFLSMQAETWQEIIDWMQESGLIQKAMTATDVMAEPNA